MSASLYGPAFFAGRSETVTRSAQVVVPYLMQLLAPESVFDVGCGKGEWLSAFPDAVHKSGVDICLPETDPGYHDLTEPLYNGGGYIFDLVLCVEVGEHLPESAADTLVQTIIDHAGDIVFSAAVPGQEGTGHINCQPHEYWHAKFAAHGYETRDLIRPLIAGDHRVSPWYRNNTFLYLEPA